MGFNCGIIGLPNVGKSTIFNALTNAGAESKNYPFCTIEPNIGIIEVQDSRIIQLEKAVNPKKTVRTTMEFVDIAGLVKGASKGEGLGNKFLSHIRSVNALCHVVRCFKDDNISHVNKYINPVEDAEIINLELILADLELVEKATFRLQKLIRGADKDAKAEFEILEIIKSTLDSGKPARNADINESQYNLIRSYSLLSLKPVLYAANVSEEHLGSKENNAIEKLREYAARENANFVKLSGKIESELTEISDEEAIQYLKEIGVAEPGLVRLIKAGYDLLGLITYFTAGVEEVRAWTIVKKTRAQDAAAKIHSDISKGFIRAEVTSFADFEQFETLALAKENGRLRLEGKDYIVNDGDIMYFRFNV